LGAIASRLGKKSQTGKKKVKLGRRKSDQEEGQAWKKKVRPNGRSNWEEENQTDASSL
jgi:hypothetical protein